MSTAIDKGDLRAQNGLGARCSPFETRCTVERIVIGRGERRHPVLDSALHQFFRRRDAVEQGVVGVSVQFDVYASPALPVEEPALLVVMKDREGRAAFDGELVVVTSGGPLPPGLPLAPVFIDVDHAP